MGDWLNVRLRQNLDDVVDSSEYLEKYEIIGLFFTAKWCTPCREFEKKLSLLHKYIQSGDLLSFGIIVVSDDNEEEEYEQHVSELPWPAISYENLKEKSCRIGHLAKLKRQYRVTALPKLVIIESRSGKVLNHDAKNDVENDLKGIDFPWIEPSVLDLMKGKFLQNGENVIVSGELMAKKYLGIFFSADWCPPCRKILPVVSSLQASLKENGFEVVYCSMDRDEDKFHQSTQLMPWYVFPWKDARVRQLVKILQIEDIPQLVIWNCSTNTLVNKNAIPRIKLDLQGKEYPWNPENLTVLSMANIEDMSHNVVFLYITESAAELDTNFSKVREIADWYGEEFRFYIVSDEDHVVSRLRDILQIGDQCPYLLFLDFEAKVMARCINKCPAAADIAPFVEAVKAGSIDLINFPSYKLEST